MGDILGDVGEPGLAEFIRLHIVNLEPVGLRAYQEGLFSHLLAVAVGHYGVDLAASGSLVGGVAELAAGSLVHIYSLHSAEYYIAGLGILAEGADVGAGVDADVLPAQGETVHDAESAGLAGKPDPAAGVLENGIYEGGREVLVEYVPAGVLQAMAVGVEDIDAVLGGRGPDF